MTDAQYMLPVEQGGDLVGRLRALDDASLYEALVRTFAVCHEAAARIEADKVRIREAVAAERERCAAKADAWQSANAVALAKATGMSAEHLEVAQRVANGIAAAIRAGEVDRA